MTNDELEQYIYSRTRQFVGAHVLQVVNDLLAPKQWTSVEKSLPDVYAKVLIVNTEGIEVAYRTEAVPDMPDEMGHDAGWIGYFAFPARSFGNPDYQRPAQFQPTHWMPMPEHPDPDADPLT